MPVPVRMPGNTFGQRHQPYGPTAARHGNEGHGSVPRRNGTQPHGHVCAQIRWYVPVPKLNLAKFDFATHAASVANTGEHCEI